ncbi:MAG: PTS sugar transporter subunit IIC [Deferribacteraceae bacterium]|jgi:PTS system mannose-specific IIC component|nr:PTS sugar transporter subunit IIC [Deferribacteraceae bacterium]
MIPAYALLAGIFAMDRTTAFNFAISRPFAVSAIIGLMCGNLEWCLIGGVFFELIGLMDLPVGTRIPSDDTFGAFAYSLVAAQAGTITLTQALCIIIAAFIIMFPVTYSAYLLRRINASFQDKYPDREGLLILIGQIFSFLRGVLFYGIGAALCYFFYAVFHTFFPPLPNFVLIVFLAAICGYFMAYFNIIIWEKLILFVAGGVISWLLF